ncbi:MAG TPA: Ig-like domain-containing protein [Pyrinomonadaceae bacterium]|nr:Ig-like domain-containing protein [Pyrinomonadaceae bacterium]
MAKISVMALCLAIAAAVPVRGQQSATEAYFVFKTGGGPETFVFKLTDPQTIQQARTLIATGTRMILSGIIIKQPVYYNSPWSYHLDPKTIRFTDGAIELCDASIRYLEDNLHSAYPGWCPWASDLLAEIPAPEKPGPGNLKPAVSITHPYADNKWGDLSPSTITVAANADDPDGTITKVEFQSGELTGSTTVYPFNFTWHNLAAGTYTVTATATDDKGEKTTSKGVTFVISAGPPQLLTDPASLRAIALESVTLMKEPFPVVAEHPLSSEQRTRLVLFGVNLEIGSEDLSVISAQAEDSQQKIYALPVEAVRTVPRFPWLNQVTVRLTEELLGVEEVWLSVSVRGVRTNKVPVKLR